MKPGCLGRGKHGKLGPFWVQSCAKREVTNRLRHGIISCMVASSKLKLRPVTVENPYFNRGSDARPHRRAPLAGAPRLLYQLLDQSPKLCRSCVARHDLVIADPSAS